jgi:Peptidase family M23
MRRALTTALAALGLAWLAAGASGAPVAADLAFYPQAGILWRDLYVNNFVDLDPGPGLRDFACGTHTYDGHTGIDSDIRSFREMDIGVPVFAALDGRVISVQDGNYDRNFGSNTPPFDNHVVLEHATGRFTIYGHLRKGIGLRRGRQVRAGQQLGWTASSGNSSWPHLHFTSHVGGDVSEPFAGRCREGASGWTEQMSLPTEPYVRDLALSASPFTGKRDLPHDLAVRTGTFVRGMRIVHLRLELGAVEPGEPLSIRITRPDGSTAVDRPGSVGFPVYHGRGRGSFAFRLALAQTGTWRIHLGVGSAVSEEATFSVVARPRQVRNRAPGAVSPALHPAAPSAADAVQCRVTTSLVNEDPDFEIVRYRYRWSAGGRVVRAVTSAALSDMVAKGTATAGQELACAVTPSDGKRAGPTATVSATVR